MMVRRRCKLVAVTVGVALVVGLVEVCVLVPLYKTHNVIKSDNYTEGDTDVNTFNPLYCKAVEMTKSEQSTASLYLVNARPQLTWRDTLLAKFNDNLAPEDYFADWSFHIHSGSNLTLSICAVTVDPDCKLNQRDKMWFKIIWGEKNFSLWQGNMGNSKYAANSTRIPVMLRYCLSPYIATYSYLEEGDYWHVIRTFLGTCAVRVVANITIERTQYSNNVKSDLGNCEVPGKQGLHKCSVPVKTTYSRYYTYLAVDQTSKVTEWKNDIHVTLTCIPRDWIWGVGLGILGVGVALVSVMWGGYCLWHRRRTRRTSGYDLIHGANTVQDQEPVDPINVSQGRPPHAVQIPNIATSQELEAEPRGSSAPARQHYAPESYSSLRPFEKEMVSSGAHGFHGGGASDSSEAGAGSDAPRESGGRTRRKRRSTKKTSPSDSAGAVQATDWTK